MHNALGAEKIASSPSSDFWLGKSVLVTGATGFLGGWLIRELREQGANVVALVRRPKPVSQFFLTGMEQDVAVEPGDVGDRDMIESLLRRHEVDVIFHTALAGGDVNASLSEPVDCFLSTVQSTVWLLDAIRRNHPETTLVVSSSDKAYGVNTLPYREVQPLAPMHPQEVCKASADLIAQSYGRVYDLKVGVTRCANFYGPYDFNFSRIVPYVTKCIAAGEAPVLRSNGQFVRDFIYVQEAAWAHLDLAQRLNENPSLYGEVFNFSYGASCTVLDLVHRLIALAGSDLQPVIRDETRHEIPGMSLCSNKARDVLAWRPRRGFHESLATTVEWYLEYFAARRELPN